MGWKPKKEVEKYDKHCEKIIEEWKAAVFGTSEKKETESRKKAEASSEVL